VGNQKAYSGVYHYYGIKIRIFPGTQGQVKKDVGKYKGAPAYELAKPVI
jgi:hypothetical protein